MAADAADRRWMRLALALARRGLGRVAPNPSVGALVVRDGVVLGRGVTTDGGRPHAETVALAQARDRYGDAAIRGATAYVTLEPCAHHGLTPPCADALVEAGVRRVVAPLEDPDPRVSGGGFARLRAGGVEVETGVLVPEARAVNAGFLSRLERGRPWTLLKLAATLDGRIATETGESRWITGPQARLRAHLMRAEADAVMVGAGTARADDPSLDIRGFGAAVAQPVRVVMDARLSLDPGARLVTTARRQPTWLLHGPGAPPDACEQLAAAGCHLLPGPVDGRGRLEPVQAVARLAEAGITRLLCEGGGQLAAALLAADLVDEIALFTAGIALGAEGRPAIGPLGRGRLSEAGRFHLTGEEAVGGDVLSHWRRV